MRRLIWIALAVAIVPWLVIGVVNATGKEDRGDAYFVRAIFDNASSLVQGEDVKIAGAAVGVVDDLEVAPDKKAAVVLRIDNTDFTPWRQDASCTIRPQSLIGEKFVECKPGTTAAPKLRTIANGDGEGERLLPVQNNSSPVDLDLLNDTLRLPYRQRLAILLNEFGTGLAGRGETLNAVIHRANPALRETDDLLAVLAKQNKTLERLAKDSDKALGPIAREREHVSDFIVKATITGQASAERAADIQRGIERLPGFLRELKPLMADLDSLAKQGTPVVDDLGQAAPQLGRLIERPRHVRRGVERDLPQPRRRARARPAGAHPGTPADPAARRARPRGEAGREQPGQAHGVAQGHRRHPAHQRLRLLPHAGHERLRLARPLPARRLGLLLELLQLRARAGGKHRLPRALLRPRRPMPPRPRPPRRARRRTPSPRTSWPPAAPWLRRAACSRS